MAGNVAAELGLLKVSQISAEHVAKVRKGLILMEERLVAAEAAAPAGRFTRSLKVLLLLLD